MSKYWYTKTLVLALVILALSACGGGSEAETGPEPSVTPARYVTPAPFNPTGTPIPAGEPVADDDFIRVEEAALQVVPPGECSLVENVAEPNKLGSAKAFDYKLRFGFGCPSADPDVRLEEMQLHTASSVASFDSECASGDCDASRITADDFQAQWDAWQSGQAAAGWSLVDLGGRTVMARSVQQAGAPVVMRHYAEFCGDVRVENRVVLLGEDAQGLEANADSFFAGLGLSCQSGS